MNVKYFNIRGRGEPIRITLADSGAEWKNDTVPRDEWRALKDTGLEDGTIPFGQMPVLEDGAHKYVQMNAILRHVARKLGKYYGSTEYEQSLVDMYLDGAEDLRNKYSGLAYRGGFENDKELSEALMDSSKGIVGSTGLLDKFERILSRNGTKFLVGAEPTIADFSLFCVIDDMMVVAPGILSEFPKLSAWFNNVRSRPNIASYLDSNPENRKQVNGNQLGSGFSL
eukprot:gb/GECG01009912.1/.p1 GENE.gb/GECG01009912.1/~~gb/GECG01009912.1/.p1  ORF type:complete len:226 (+),score=27.65 gb/GECG01009912.1/:1-678(+)